MDPIILLPKYVTDAITEYSNAQWECAEWDAQYAEEPWDDVYERAERASEQLTEAIIRFKREA